jgi:phage baseplate assembly protein gpV
MAIGSGIGSQLGIATETTFNTPVTVSRFYEFTSENLNYNKKTAVGMGLRAGGLLPRSQRRVVTTSDVTGDISLDLPTRGLGLLLSQSTGTVPSPTTVSTGVYSYTFTLGDVYGKSFTAQVGVPQYNGTVTPKTVAGAKVSSFELSVANAAIAMGKFNIDGASITTGISLATASYSSATNLFNFSQGAITLDGTSIANIRDFSVTVDNTLKGDRYNLGSSGIKAEQLINGFRKISGKITAEFTDTTLFGKVLSDANAAIVLTFTGATIASTYKETLSITISAAKFNADTPKVTSPGVIDLSMDFEAYDNGTDAPLTIVYQTADSAL